MILLTGGQRGLLPHDKTELYCNKLSIATIVLLAFSLFSKAYFANRFCHFLTSTALSGQSHSGGIVEPRKKEKMEAWRVGITQVVPGGGDMSAAGLL
jgi:hypothetical protein